MQQMQQLYWGVNGTLISIFHIEIWKVDLLGVFNFHILVKRVKICANHFLFKIFSVENHNLVLRLFTSHYAYNYNIASSLYISFYILSFFKVVPWKKITLKIEIYLRILLERK